jgi:3-oxoacyl-[acyl-carrier-protein] synthase III
VTGMWCSACDKFQSPNRQQPTTPACQPPAGTCILFGDGCGAVLLSAAPDGQPCSLLGVDMHSDGNGQKSLHAMYSGCGGKPFQVGFVWQARAGHRRTHTQRERPRRCLLRLRKQQDLFQHTPCASV